MMAQVKHIEESSQTLGTNNLGGDVKNVNGSSQLAVKPVYAAEYVLDLGIGQEAGVADLAKKIFGDGNNKDRLEISQLKGGITNMLLKGKYYYRARGEEQCCEFLVRAYGHGTGAIIDRDREFATHLSLYGLNLAPPLYSRFGNGLMYGFIPGRATHYTELSDVEIMRAVSNRLAEWHAKLDRRQIETSIKEMKQTFGGNQDSRHFSRDLWEIMDRWIKSMPEGVLSATAEELQKELQWFKSTLGHVGPVVVGHCDLLSGNILVPEDWKATEWRNDDNANTNYNSTATNADTNLKYSSSSKYHPSSLVTFIDYEYAMPVPRGFDLANHFMEWQGFDCKTELIPKPERSNNVLRYWAFHYLSAIRYFKDAEAHRTVSEQDIDELIDEMITWWGMPGFYWGIWAAIQSTISEIDFDYAPYAQQRLNEYYIWKDTMYKQLRN